MAREGVVSDTICVEASIGYRKVHLEHRPDWDSPHQDIEDLPDAISYHLEEDCGRHGTMLLSVNNSSVVREDIKIERLPTAYALWRMSMPVAPTGQGTLGIKRLELLFDQVTMDMLIEAVTGDVGCEG